MNDLRIHRNMKIARVDSALKLGCSDWLMWPSTEHIEKDIKRSSFFHSKDGRYSVWGLLHYDDWRSPWWASRDGPQHDRSRSDTVIISMNFNSYASLVIYFIIPVLFCFGFEHETFYTIRFLSVFDFYHHRHLYLPYFTTTKIYLQR